MNPGSGIFSKLPDVGTTIFTVMSRRATEQGAVNVGQGFPDYPIDPDLASLRRRRGRRPVSTSTRPWKAASRCAPPSPPRSPRPAAVRVDADTELTVSCGGTESIYSAIQAVVGAGDEAIVFDPAYDAYDPAIRLAGGRCIHIPLEPPHFRYDWDRVRASPERAHAADHHQQSAQPGVHRGHGGGSRHAGGADARTVPSACSPTKSTNTCSTTGACTSRS